MCAGLLRPLFLQITIYMSYEERLHWLRLWSLEERSNRQDFIVVFKMCNGLSRFKLNVLFTLDDNRGTRGHSWKLAIFRCTRDCCKYFFSNRVINRWNQLDQRAVGASIINAFKGWLNKIREQGWASSWTSLPSLGLPGGFSGW